MLKLLCSPIYYAVISVKIIVLNKKKTVKLGDGFGRKNFPRAALFKTKLDNGVN